MNRHVIIVAGGKGLRMGGDIPKQFLPVGGKPVLMRTIEAFYAFDSSMHIILVLPVSQQAYWKDLCETYHFALRHDIADGGETRFHSLQNGKWIKKHCIRRIQQRGGTHHPQVHRDEREKVG